MWMCKDIEQSMHYNSNQPVCQ